MAVRGTRWHERGVPAPLLFVVGGISMYAGAAIAVVLFAQLAPSAVAWLRLVAAAIVLLAWRRPWRAVRVCVPSGNHWKGRRLLLASSFGLATALMNVAFYEAIARLPLGTVVAIEFCGPVAVAAMGSRTRRDATALVLAALGVLLIADVQWSGSPAGVLFALLAAAMWATYILLGMRVAGAGHGIDDMALGFAVAAVLLCPLGIGAAPALGSPSLLALGAGVGVLSSVVPYALDQVVLRRVGQARFALLLALLPATASVVGLVALGQVPRPLEAAGIGAVIAAVALRSTEPVKQRRDRDGPDAGSGRP